MSSNNSEQSKAINRVNNVINHVDNNNEYKCDYSTKEGEVLIEMYNNGLGVLILNRSSALNSLNLNMIHILLNTLRSWSHNPSIKLVLILSNNSKSFCAGGDIKSLAYPPYQYYSETLFRYEYTLDYIIHNYNKPYIALLNGIVMGGGMGLSMNGKYRIVSENITAAMPETGIGLFPDVGGSYFLPRLKSINNYNNNVNTTHIGLYLGLTGNSIKYRDCIYSGIATHFCEAAKTADIVHILKTHNFRNSNDVFRTVDELLKPYQCSINNIKSCNIDAHTSTLLQYEQSIYSCFTQAKSVKEIMNNLLQYSNNESNAENYRKFALLTLNQLKTKSPLSMEITYYSYYKGLEYDNLSDCLIMEYRLGARCVSDYSTTDFVEGVRALIVDKDKKPKWKPWPNNQIVESYFAPFNSSSNKHIAQLSEWKAGQI